MSLKRMIFVCTSFWKDPMFFVILDAYKSNQDLDIKKIDKLFNGFEM